MKRVRPWKLAESYIDETICGVRDLIVSRAAEKLLEGGIAAVDGTSKLLREPNIAVVVRGGLELGENGTATSAEAVQSGRDVRDGPLHSDLPNGSGRGDSTDSQDTEDGGETHAVRVFEKVEGGGRC